MVTIHDLVFLENRATYAGRLNAWYATAATRRAAQTASVILAGASETLERLERHFGTSRQKIEIVPYGVSPTFFRSDEAIRDGSSSYYLFVGTFEPRKGLDVLYTAYRTAKSRRPDLPRLVVAGRPGWGIEELVERLASDPNVELVISPTDDELSELYAGAIALVFSSRMEGFGLPVAEAMAAGAPVVSSGLDCVREFAEEVPLYVTPGDARALAEKLIEVVDLDAGERADRTRAGVELARRLSWHAVGEKAAQALETAVARQASHG